MVDYINLIPLAAIVFAAGALYQKFKAMVQDIKDIKKENTEIKKQLNEIGERRSEHDRLIKSQHVAFSVYIEAFTSLIITLAKTDIIQKDELFGILGNVSRDSINKTLQAIAGGTGNPITKKEAMILQEYVKRARANESFTPEDAQDFYNISKKVSQDRSDDEGAWGILMLAAFISAVHVLGKKS